jgi:hypothetical protein
MAKFTRPRFLLAISLFLAWVFDYFFWGKQWGISFAIFTLLLVGVGFLFAYRQGLLPARESLWLLIPILFFAAFSVVRLEPFTLLLCRILVLLLVCVLALTFLGGRWVDYSFSDFVAKLIGLIPIGLLQLRNTRATPAKKENHFFPRSILPVLRGLLFAIPLLWFLAVLLSSADPIFQAWLNSLFQFLNMDNAAEYIFRGFYILILAYVFAGVYLYSLIKSRKEELIGKDRPLISPLLGFGEAVTMLASVNLLFTAFVIVQFRYFFGGAANIINNPSGLTYAEYARRGFGELVFVAVTSLLFFVILSSARKRENLVRQRWFSGLGIALFVLVAVILISAYQRLLLYESVYGFTRIRTYAHVFMIWVALLLLVIVVLEALQRQRAFAVAALLAALGFAASLSLLNVDAFIVRANIQRDQLGYELDIPYIASLSEDAVPSLVSRYQEANLAGDSNLAAKLAAALACHAVMHGSYSTKLPWQSWNLARENARQAWSTVSSEDAFSISILSQDPLSIRVAGTSQACEDPKFSD